MNTLSWILSALAAGVVIVWIALRVVGSLRQYWGKSIVTCPETQQAVAVKIGPKAAATAGLANSAAGHLRLSDCTRWPERRDCGQECLGQIEAAPENCLLRSILARWYHGKACVLCGGLFDEVDWFEHRPGVVNAAGETFEWSEIAGENIPETLSTHKPVCWTCHTTERFRRQFPELVLERPARSKAKAG
jgi:hypothetical protein